MNSPYDPHSLSKWYRKTALREARVPRVRAGVTDTSARLDRAALMSHPHPYATDPET
jgi:hypothetical protein